MESDRLPNQAGRGRNRRGVRTIGSPAENIAVVQSLTGNPHRLHRLRKRRSAYVSQKGILEEPTCVYTGVTTNARANALLATIAKGLDY